MALRMRTCDRDASFSKLVKSEFSILNSSEYERSNCIPFTFGTGPSHRCRAERNLRNAYQGRNRVVQCHDLVNLTDEHSDKVFGDSSDRTGTLHLLDAYLESIELSADANGTVLEAIADQAHRITGGDPPVRTLDHQQIVAGPGF